MPDLRAAWNQVKENPTGPARFLGKWSASAVLILDEWLLDPPDKEMRGLLLEILERRYGAVSTIFCTRYPQEDWHQRLGGGVHADAIMDRIVRNTL